MKENLFYFELDASSFTNQVSEFFGKVDWNLFSFYAAWTILGVILIILIISFWVNKRKDQEFKKALSYENATIRVFRIDKSKSSVRYFNLGDMKNVKVSSLEGFYASFPAPEQSRIEEWINALLTGENVPQYLETDVFFRKDKRVVPSFLKVDKVFPDKGLLHLESYLLRFDQPLRPGRRALSTEGDFAEALKSNGSSSGMTFCFVLTKKDDGTPDFDPRLKDALVSNELSLRFRDALSPYVSGTEKMIQLSPSELVVANFDMSELSQAILYSLKAKEGIDKYFAPNKRRTRAVQYEVKCGIVPNKDCLGDSDLILTEARRSALGAAEEPLPLSFYKKGERSYSVADQLHYRSEVDRIIYEKKLSYTYRPIYDTDRGKVMGYLARCMPLGTSFSSIDELKNYAIRAKDEKSLFAAIAKNLIPRFNNERFEKNQSLFYPLRMDEREFLTSFFSRYQPSKDANLIFLFQENDVAASLDKAGVASFISDLAALHKRGFKAALSLCSKTLVLDPSLYTCFDDFLVDFSSSGDEKNMDTSIRSELHALVEKLLKYRKPIIGTNLMNWNSIELVVGSGISYISSDVFAPYDTMFRPLPPKNVDRITVMKNRK